MYLLIYHLYMITKYATHVLLIGTIAMTTLPSVGTAVGLHQSNISQWYPLLQKPYNADLQNTLTSYSANVVHQEPTVSQPFNLFGQVRDRSSDAPQPDATVELKKFDVGTQRFVTIQTGTTDENGNYGFVNVDPNGTYGLVATASGYEPFMYYHVAIDGETVIVHAPVVKIRK